MSKGPKKEIIETITAMSGRYAPYNIFSDWVMTSAIAIQNLCCMIHDECWQEREKLYISTMERYTESEREAFAKMFVLLGGALTENMSDVLGEIYMEASRIKRKEKTSLLSEIYGKITGRCG